MGPGGWGFGIGNAGCFIAAKGSDFPLLWFTPTPLGTG
jgi:hypothetical protein